MLIVVGLTASAPASCWCAPDEHFGSLLHPIFPHAHGDARTVLSDDALASGAVDQAPGISAATSFPGTHDAMAGLLLPLSLAALLLSLGRRAPPTEARLDQRSHAPPVPPPRLAPLAA